MRELNSIFDHIYSARAGCEFARLGKINQEVQTWLSKIPVRCLRPARLSRVVRLREAAFLRPGGVALCILLRRWLLFLFISPIDQYIFNVLGYYGGHQKKITSYTRTNLVSLPKRHFVLPLCWRTTTGVPFPPVEVWTLVPKAFRATRPTLGASCSLVNAFKNSSEVRYKNRDKNVCFSLRWVSLTQFLYF